MQTKNILCVTIQKWNKEEKRLFTLVWNGRRWLVALVRWVCTTGGLRIVWSLWRWCVCMVAWRSWIRSVAGWRRTLVKVVIKVVWPYKHMQYIAQYFTAFNTQWTYKSTSAFKTRKQNNGQFNLTTIMTLNKCDCNYYWCCCCYY